MSLNNIRTVLDLDKLSLFRLWQTTHQKPQASYVSGDDYSFDFTLI